MIHEISGLELCKRAVIVAPHSYVGSNTTIKGDLECREDFLVEGAVEGNLSSEGLIVLGKGAVVKREVTATSHQNGCGQRAIIILALVPKSIRDLCRYSQLRSVLQDKDASKYSEIPWHLPISLREP